MNISFQHEHGLGLLGLLGKIQKQVNEGSDVHELFHSHWKEIATNKDMLVLNPDYSRYRKLIERDMLVVISARDGGKIIGYIIIMVDNHAHYKTVKVSLEDIHFIDPKYRHQGIGRGMILAAEEVLRKRGVQLATMRVKLHSDHGPLLQELGYSPLETIYAKELK